MNQINHRNSINQINQTDEINEIDEIIERIEQRPRSFIDGRLREIDENMTSEDGPRSPYRSTRLLTNTIFFNIKNSKLGEFPLKVISPDSRENKPEMAEAYLDINAINQTK